jgi:hypothetical protein
MIIESFFVNPRVIKEIGVITCLYVNPETDQFWAIDYRIYNPDVEG